MYNILFRGDFMSNVTMLCKCSQCNTLKTDSEIKSFDDDLENYICVNCG